MYYRVVNGIVVLGYTKTDLAKKTCSTQGKEYFWPEDVKKSK